MVSKTILVVSLLASGTCATANEAASKIVRRDTNGMEPSRIGHVQKHSHTHRHGAKASSSTKNTYCNRDFILGEESQTGCPDGSVRVIDVAECEEAGRYLYGKPDDAYPGGTPNPNLGWGDAAGPHAPFQLTESPGQHFVLPFPKKCFAMTSGVGTAFKPHVFFNHDSGDPPATGEWHNRSDGGQQYHPSLADGMNWTIGAEEYTQVKGSPICVRDKFPSGQENSDSSTCTGDFEAILDHAECASARNCVLGECNVEPAADTEATGVCCGAPNITDEYKPRGCYQMANGCFGFNKIDHAPTGNIMGTPVCKLTPVVPAPAPTPAPAADGGGGAAGAGAGGDEIAADGGAAAAAAGGGF